MPTNTRQDSTQDKETASNSIPDFPVCVAGSTPYFPPSIPTLTLTTSATTTTTPSQEPLLVNSALNMSDKIQISKEPGVCVETGYGRSADPSPRPPQKQYSNINVRKQQNKNRGRSYGSSKGMFVVVR